MSSSLYTDVILLFFSFFWKTSACARARRAREKEKNKLFFFPHPYPFALAVNESPRFIFYHARSTDFEEKIEGL